MSTKLMAFVGGVMIAGPLGFLAGVASVEEKTRRRYEEAAKYRENAMKMAENLTATKPEQSEYDWPVEAVEVLERYDGSAAESLANSEMVKEMVETLIPAEPTIEFDGDTIIAEDGTIMLDKFRLEKSREAAQQILDSFNPEEGWAYIEPEDFEEPCGRDKQQMSIMIQDNTPIFILDGNQVPNGFELVGPDILTEFYRRCPPNEDQILYVRNLGSQVDYEICLVV